MHGSLFTIKIDQKSLKFLLEQKLNIPLQQVWMAKLMGFEFDIQYKEGKTNVAVDALSRRTHTKLNSAIFHHGG